MRLRDWDCNFCSLELGAGFRALGFVLMVFFPHLRSLEEYEV